MKNDYESLTHIKWRCQYLVVITQANCFWVFEKKRTRGLVSFLKSLHHNMATIMSASVFIIL